MSYQTDIYAGERTAETPGAAAGVTISGMAARENVETWEEMEARLSRLSDEAWAGAHDEAVMAVLDDLAARLPDGYALEGGHIVRLDPSLPPYVTVAQKHNGQIVGQVTVPAR